LRLPYLLRAFVLIAALVQASPAWSDTRVALIVAASGYEHQGALTQPPNDARKIHDALSKVGGFSYLPEVLLDPTEDELRKALQEFSSEAAQADFAFFYYSGHGMQHDEDNWLIPVDATLEAEDDIIFQGIRTSDVHKAISKAKLRVIVLDACRNNPFSLSWEQDKAIDDGLAEVKKVPLGAVLAYAAAAKKKAPDNGEYASALARYIEEPGLELRQIFEKVFNHVKEKSPGTSPEFSPAYQGNFSFQAGYEPPETDADPEESLWLQASTSKDLKNGEISDAQCELLRTYKSTYPKGRFYPDLFLAQCSSFSTAEKQKLEEELRSSVSTLGASGFDPVRVLEGLVLAFQNCGPVDAYSILSPTVFDAVRVETGSTGCYPQIQAAGQIIGMQLISALQRNEGPLYRIRVFHAAAISDWVIGIDTKTARVDSLYPGAVGAPFFLGPGQIAMQPNGVPF
jgi:hypothetical protein